MPFFEIPLDPQYAAQQLSVRLDSYQYKLRFRWNDRLQLWHMDVQTDAGTMLIAGAPLLPNWPPLRPYTHPLLPRGRCLVLDTGNARTEPTRYDYGSRGRIRLMYEGANAV